MTRACAIPDCGKPFIARGWCAAHWVRWRRHGDPLAGRPPLTPQAVSIRYFREVVLTYDGDECHFWPFGRGSDGYSEITIDGVTTGVHRRVCEHVHGPTPTPKHEAAHSCGRGEQGCVTKRHLRWATKAENKADELLHGTRNRGERHGAAKLTDAEAREILALKGKVTQMALAARYGVSGGTIGNLHSRRRWAWL